MDTVFVGHDWAEAHHDAHVEDSEGRRLAKARLPEGWTASPVSTSWWRPSNDVLRATLTTAPLRPLANRLVGILHGCLHHGALYDEHVAWGHRSENAA